MSSLKNYYDQKGRLFLPPFKPGEGLPERLYKAFAKEQETKEQAAREEEAKAKQADPSSSNGIDSTVSVEQEQQAGSSGADIQVGVEKDPLGDSCMQITRDTGIVLPKQLDLKNFPLASAMVETLAEYMGIDLSPEACEAENRSGIAFVIHGPVNSGKTTQAKALGSVYEAPVLQLDAVIIDAISSASTAAGRKARELCIQALSAKSVDSETAAAPPPQGTKKVQVIVKEHPVKEHPPSDAPLAPVFSVVPFTVDPHEDKEYAVPGKTLIPTQLPEDTMVEIFSERLQQQDCCRGIVVDGVESQFSTNPVVSTAVILRAFNNRKHIYFINLSLDLQIIKNRLGEIEQQRLMKIREENKKKREAEKQERDRIESLLDVDEDEYEAFTEEQKAEVDAICLQHKKFMRERRQLANEERERQEREKKEEEERLKDLEKSKKKGKGKQLQKLGQPPPPAPPKQQITARPDSVSSGVFPQLSQALSGFVGASSKVSLVSTVDSPTTGGAVTPRHKSFKRKTSAKTSALVESEEDVVKLEKLYGQYKSGMEGVKTLLEDWDRQRGVARPKKSPEPEEAPKPTPTRKSRGFKQKDLDVPIVTPEVEDSREGVGVPFIDVHAGKSIAEISELILSAELPTPGDILLGMGIGPNGPPIPGSFSFQICPLSLKRRSQDPPSDVYSFIISSPEDP